mmetsp:Transcript_2147/g.6528  ORF Transcript_2147/g.6528 Transcript_2147/m.6528 type:complete len:353 (+) Transcript_2147:2121-3179(+)
MLACVETDIDTLALGSHTCTLGAAEAAERSTEPDSRGAAGTVPAACAIDKTAPSLQPPVSLEAAKTMRPEQHRVREELCRSEEAACVGSVANAATLQGPSFLDNLHRRACIFEDAACGGAPTDDFSAHTEPAEVNAVASAETTVTLSEPEDNARQAPEAADVAGVATEVTIGDAATSDSAALEHVCVADAGHDTIADRSVAAPAGAGEAPGPRSFPSPRSPAQSSPCPAVGPPHVGAWEASPGALVLPGAAAQMASAGNASPRGTGTGPRLAQARLTAALDDAATAKAGLEDLLAPGPSLAPCRARLTDLLDPTDFLSPLGPAGCQAGNLGAKLSWNSLCDDDPLARRRERG